MEMLVVMSVIVTLLVLVSPALGPLKGSQDVTTAAYNVAGVLETARNYAIANNTYTWIGFYEQDYSRTATPGGTMPPAGVGHVTIGVVYSKDGTKLVDDPASGVAASSTTLPPASLGQVDKLVQIYAIHLDALAAPQNANSTDPTVANTLPGRPYQTGLAGTDLSQTLINSGTPDTFRPFTVQGYTFSKTIRFNPRGEANVNSTLPCTRIIEIGLQPTSGNVANTRTTNLVAIQQAGIGGAVNIYRP